MDKNKKTLILGASTNPERYSYKAAKMLLAHGYEIVLVGAKKGDISGLPIQNANEIYTDIHTITLYVGPRNQAVFYDYIIQTHPKRIIFNPGTDNPELKELATLNHIQVLDACTLVLLSTNQY